MTIDEAKIKIEELACYARTKGWDDEYTEAVNMAIKALEQEPYDDAVSKQTVIDTVDEWIKSMHILTALSANDVTPLFENVHNLPSVTSQSKMGKWLIKRADGYDHAVCSVCGDDSYLSPEWDALELYRYCPNCGSKIQEVEE